MADLFGGGKSSTPKVQQVQPPVLVQPEDITDERLRSRQIKQRSNTLTSGGLLAKAGIIESILSGKNKTLGL